MELSHFDLNKENITMNPYSKYYSFLLNIYRLFSEFCRKK